MSKLKLVRLASWVAVFGFVAVFGMAGTAQAQYSITRTGAVGVIGVNGSGYFWSAGANGVSGGTGSTPFNGADPADSLGIKIAASVDAWAVDGTTANVTTLPSVSATWEVHGPVQSQSYSITLVIDQCSTCQATCDNSDCEDGYGSAQCTAANGLTSSDSIACDPKRNPPAPGSRHGVLTYATVAMGANGVVSITVPYGQTLTAQANGGSYICGCLNGVECGGLLTCKARPIQIIAPEGTFNFSVSMGWCQ